MTKNHSPAIVPFTVMQLGDLRAAEASLAIGQANQVQTAVYFDLRDTEIRLDRKRYRLSNATYDLDAAAAHLRATTAIPAPLILLTSVPYGDRAHRTDPDGIFFADYSVSGARDVAIISTFLWERLPGRRPLQPYLLLGFATAILSHCAGIEFHQETQGCPFDYCDVPKHIDKCLTGAGLCGGCQRHLEHAMRNGRISLQQVAAATKIFNRAIGRKLCFVVMPFKRGLDGVYDAVSRVLRGRGWTVIRADELPHPRRITDAIVQAILSSNLIIADLTHSNPNVFYEVGMAHASGCDVVLLTQEAKLPFDVTTERAIRYKSDRQGLQKLDRELRRFVDDGRW